MVKLKSQFDGAVSEFFEKHAPSDLRDPIKKAKKNQIVSDHYPYQKRLQREAYEKTMYRLQIELAKFQNWVRSSDERIVVVFEGRDAAGKGGVIKRVTENLNPRNTHVIALGKPSSNERGQWISSVIFIIFQLREI